MWLRVRAIKSSAEIIYLPIFKMGAMCYVYVADEEMKLFNVKEQPNSISHYPESGSKFGNPGLYELGLKTLNPCKQNCQEIFIK